MFVLKTLGYINFKWNCMIGFIHDLSAKCGVGNWTVWFYDTFTWYLPLKWQVFGGKRYEVYILEYELSIAQHQIRFYSDVAVKWMIAYLETLPDAEDRVEVSSSDLKKSTSSEV